MFCVIQEIKLRKEQARHVSKRLEPYFSSLVIDGEEVGSWTYRYSEDKFERPIKKAYKISIHESYRENGKVRKKQICLFTYNYYDFADGYIDSWDIENKVKKIANEFNCELHEILEVIYSKLDPLEREIKNEYRLTEEYKVRIEQEEILKAHHERVKEFKEKYESNEYYKCYDVFGVLRNESYLKKVQQEYEYRKMYEEKSRSYQEEFYSNYSNFYGKGGNYGSPSGSYGDKERTMLKQFHRVLAKYFHPDSNPDKDTSEEMKLINQLKNDWGV